MAKKTVFDFQRMKEKGEKITYLVIYDFWSAKLAEEAGIDMILCGDSVGMGIYGYDSTLPVMMEQMLYHSEAVRRGAANTFVIGDMPFGSYQVSPDQAVENAIRFHQKARVDAVKLEGGRVVAGQIKAIVDAGMNVMGHLGLTPQSSGKIGIKAQGKTADSAYEIFLDAKAVEEAGTFAILLEAVPFELGKLITESCKIPILSIGAGMHCDGQLLLDVDLLQKASIFNPRFVKPYAHLRDITLSAFGRYIEDVKQKKFPGTEHVYEMKPGELERLENLIKKKDAKSLGVTGESQGLAY